VVIGVTTRLKMA
jgi:hypothetical protein